MQHSVLHILDEMSMLGRNFLGKILYKVQDILGKESAHAGGELPAETMMGRDVILAGDNKQAPPISDEPLYKTGPYQGKAKNVAGEHDKAGGWS